MTYRQYELEEIGGQTRVVCWLDAARRVELYSRVTLLETGPTQWRVIKAYGSRRIGEELHRPWRVGGLW